MYELAILGSKETSKYASLFA